VYRRHSFGRCRSCDSNTTISSDMCCGCCLFVCLFVCLLFFIRFYSFLGGFFFPLDRGLCGQIVFGWPMNEWVPAGLI
jgi:hypothetical protein